MNLQQKNKKMDSINTFSSKEFPAKIAALIQKVNKSLGQLHQYSSDDFVPVNKIFKNYYDQSKNVDPVVEEKPEFKVYKEVIGKIITDLQFHDIIRQKLEHIENINNLLIEELNIRVKDMSYDSEFIAVIPDICKVNEAQLVMINEEYQSTICKLRINLENMENYIAKATSVSLNLSNSFSQSANFNKLYREIISSLTHIASFISDDEKWTEQGRIDAINKIGSMYTMQSERAVFSKIFLSSVSLEADNAINGEDDIEFF